MSEYPEHEKLDKVIADSQTIGLFLDWAKGKGIELCTPHQHTEFCWEIDPDGKKNKFIACGFRSKECAPINLGIEQILGMYYKIDLKKLAAEKDAMFQKLRRRANERQQ